MVHFYNFVLQKNKKHLVVSKKVVNFAITNVTTLLFENK